MCMPQETDHPHADAARDAARSTTPQKAASALVIDELDIMASVFQMISAVAPHDIWTREYHESGVAKIGTLSCVAGTLTP